MGVVFRSLINRILNSIFYAQKSTTDNNLVNSVYFFRTFRLICLAIII